MTAKEKAEELVSKYLWPQRAFSQLAKRSVARECAKICVDEIIMSNPTKEVGLTFFNDPDTVVKPDIEYWQQVKSEIENS